MFRLYLWYVISRTFDALIFHVTKYCLMTEPLAAETLDNFVSGVEVLNFHQEVQDSS